MEISELLTYFQNVKHRGGTEYSASCPCDEAHNNNDANRSLAIGEKNNKILIHCFAGCEPSEILNRVGLSTHDLFHNQDIKYQRGTENATIERYCRMRGIISEGISCSNKVKVGKIKIKGQEIPTIEFYYPKSVVKKVAWDKSATIWEPVGGIEKTTRLWKHYNSFYPNHTPDYIYFCEGEKDALALGQAGFLAVSLPACTTRLKNIDYHYLDKYILNKNIKGVRLCYDKDEPGQKGMENLFDDLRKKYPTFVYEKLKYPEKYPKSSDITDLSAEYVKLKNPEGFISYIKNRTHYNVIPQRYNYADGIIDVNADIKKMDITELVLPFLDEYKFANNTEYHLIISRDRRGFWEIIKEENVKRNISKYYPELSALKVSKIYDELKIKAPTFEWKDINEQPIIGFKNGVYDLQQGKFRKFNAHDFVISPVHKYNTKIEGERPDIFFKSIQQWFPKATSDGIDYIFSLLAYYLFVPHKGFEIWINFFGGSGSNGKSTLMQILQDIIGEDKIGTADFKNWNKFTTASFVGKTHILAQDTGEYIEDPTAIKTITGDNTITVEPKNKQQYTYRNNWKLLASSNKLIKSHDKTEAWYRRIKVLPFLNRFTPNPNFRNKFKGAELDRIICLFCEYAYKVFKENKLPDEPPWCAEFTRETAHADNPVREWWDNLETKPDKYKIKDAYDDYKRWFEDEFGLNAKIIAFRNFGGGGGVLTSIAGKENYEYTTINRKKYIIKKGAYLDENGNETEQKELL